MDNRVICDRTGKKLFRNQCAIQWDGLLVYTKVIDPYPEYLIAPNTQENISVQNPRPEGQDVFLVPNPQTNLL